MYSFVLRYYRILSTLRRVLLYNKLVYTGPSSTHFPPVSVTLFFCCRPQINGYLSKPAQGPVIHVSQQGQRGQQEQPLMQEMTEFNNPRMERHPSRESVASYFRPQAAFNRIRGSVSQMNLNKLGRRHRQNRSKTQVDNSFETSDPESGIASSQATSQAPTEN